MLFLYRILNSALFSVINLFAACYTFLRMIRALSLKNKLTYEIEEFNAFVNQSRQCLDYVSESINKVVKEIESDLANELQMTHHCTKFEEKLLGVLKRFSKMQETALEYIRMNPNMRSIQIETPTDLNEEVKQILSRNSQEVDKKVIKVLNKKHSSRKFSFINSRENKDSDRKGRHCLPEVQIVIQEKLVEST